MKARDPTAKRNLVQPSRTHQRQTRNNTPGDVPAIQRSPGRIPADNLNPTQPRRLPQITQEERLLPNVTFTTMPTKGRPKRARLISQIAMAAAMAATASATTIIIPPYPMPGGIRAYAKLISQHALNALMMKEALYSPPVFAQRNYVHHNFVKNVPNYVHYTSPIHPTTGETISSYKQLMHDPAMAEVWQTAFGRDFGGMAQGNDKTGQKGTNSIFVMTHVKIKHAYADKVNFTYAKIVVDFRPQKEDPYRIRITARGNLLTYKGNISTRTVDLSTSKLPWNSILSTEGAKYMCLDIKNSISPQLSTTSNTCGCRCRYFQNGLKNNTNSTSMHKVVLCTYGWNVLYGASRKPGYSPTNSSEKGSPPTDILSASTLPVNGAMNGDPSHSPLSWTISE